LKGWGANLKGRDIKRKKEINSELEEIERLEAFELLIWTRMGNIKWIDRKTNEELLNAEWNQCRISMEEKKLYGSLNGEKKLVWSYTERKKIIEIGD
jgi:hypothetical protein